MAAQTPSTKPWEGNQNTTGNANIAADNSRIGINSSVQNSSSKIWEANQSNSGQANIGSIGRTEFNCGPIVDNGSSYGAASNYNTYGRPFANYGGYATPYAGGNYSNGYSMSRYGGGYGSGYGMSNYGGYGTMGGYGLAGRPPMDPMNLPAGGLGWLSSFNQIVCSLGQITELLGMNAEALTCSFGCFVGFMEKISGLLLGVVQMLSPQNAFPPGHPRHGEHLLDEEEEKRRLRRIKIVRFLLSLVFIYSCYRGYRRIFSLLKRMRKSSPKKLLADHHLESIYCNSPKRI